MFRGKKPAPKKKETLLSCPFCGLAFEDVTLHLDSCSGVPGKPAQGPAVTPQVPVVSPPTPTPTPIPSPSPSPSPLPTTPIQEEREVQEPPTTPPKPLPQTPDQSQWKPLPKVAETEPTYQRQNSGGGWIKPQVQVANEKLKTSGKEIPQEVNPLSRSRKGLAIGKGGAAEDDSEERSLTSSDKNELSESCSNDNLSENVAEEDGDDVGEQFEDEIIAKVIYDYQKENEGEIELFAGDVVVVIDMSNPEWYYVKKENEAGYIASNYLEIQNQEKKPQNNESKQYNASTDNNNSNTTAVTTEVEPEVVVRARKPTTPTPVQPQVSMASRTAKTKSKFLGSITSFGSVKKKPSEFTITRSEPEITFSRTDIPSETFEAPSTPTNEEKVDQRTKIAREILSTEQHYVRILEALEKTYKQRINEKLNTESFGKGDQKITPDNVKDIFVNINMILPFNMQLLSELEKSLNNWNEQSTIGDIFFKLAPFLKMYNQYSNSYDNALAVLTRCMKTEKFAVFIAECDAVAGLSARLDALLIAPIQRIPRYTLLLSELRKYTPESHPDLPNLEKAIPLLQEVADYINKNILLAENQAKLLSLSLAGAQSLLKPHRQLLYEGVLNEKKNKLHLYLFNDILVHITEAKSKDKRNLNDPKNQWPLHLIWLEKKPKNSFLLTGPTARYLLSSQVPDEADKWMTNILKVLEQHFEYLSYTQDLDLQREKEANMKPEDAARFGTYEFPTGETFTGWWSDGKMEGFGKFSYFGANYEGQFHEGLKEGTGTLTFNNGSVYEGEWLNDRPHGSGTFRYPNGDVYIGPWREGRKSGKGEFRSIAGDSYIGEWSDDNPEGLGEMYYRNGDVYNGNWQNGLRSHYGILINKDGTRYEGEWVAGVKHGKGRMEYEENYFYNGYWKEGMYNGQGKLVTPGFTYDGEWVADLKDGNGTIVYPNGCTYKGQWKKNLYNGNGTLTYSAGVIESYVGEWANHRKNGSGVLKYFNGDLYEGHFKDNMFHGSGTFTWADGSSLKSKWSRGKPAGESTFARGKEKSTVIHGILKDGILSTEGKPNIYIPNLTPLNMEM